MKSAAGSSLPAIALRRVHGRVEFDQHVAGLDRLPVLHPDRPHDAGLERLHQLGAVARQDFSGRRGHDVDGAPPGPEQGGAEHQRNGGRGRPTDRRRWRLHDLECRR
jgi:hypothetical protein